MFMYRNQKKNNKKSKQVSKKQNFLTAKNFMPENSKKPGKNRCWGEKRKEVIHESLVSGKK